MELHFHSNLKLQWRMRSSSSQSRKPYIRVGLCLQLPQGQQSCSKQQLTISYNNRWQEVFTPHLMSDDRKSSHHIWCFNKVFYFLFLNYQASLFCDPFFLKSSPHHSFFSCYLQDFSHLNISFLASLSFSLYEALPLHPCF